ncbi:DUF2304 domain-containing protein [Microbacterium sp. AK031]|uniref:DUF2304 domain-containing protein n=1 Tax=Microbacterium sp. AK031 TaxID=2723076 RepID=UPI002167381A|nr:DUF2304 domain-containing protein [Microbacterium sp. AK031]MCS3842100.1 hypothetical protein [Microbacterium sp. AK031]
MTIAITGVVLATVMLIVVFALLLSRRLREKYAALWIVIAFAMLILGLFPQLLLGLTSLLGVVLPANLLFAMAILLLLGVALHLSWELSQAEDEIRRAAEEIAILRADHNELSARVAEIGDGISRGPEDESLPGEDKHG